jgi:hypothetical protein
MGSSKGHFCHTLRARLAPNDSLSSPGEAWQAENWGRHLGERTQTLVFAGEIIGWEVETLDTPVADRFVMSANGGESSNVRLLVYLHHRHRPDYTIVPAQVRRHHPSLLPNSRSVRVVPR